MSTRTQANVDAAAKSERDRILTLLRGELGSVDKRLQP